MKERPILFSAPMVRAILDGRKTMTRRVVKPHGAVDMVRFISADNQPTGEFGWCPYPSLITKHIRCPYGQPGDRLWVRETWKTHSIFDHLAPRDVPPSKVFYAAGPQAYSPSGSRWRSSIHMPRWASRITLEVTGVRVERLQDITEADAIAEGVDPANEPSELRWQHYVPHAVAFRRLWESINGAGSWDDNPWVWVVEFHRITKAYEEATRS